VLVKLQLHQTGWM